MTGKILVVDPVATNRIVMKAKLSAAFYDAESVADTPKALTAAVADPPDLILLANRVPGEGSAAALCAGLRAHTETADLPILVLTDAGAAADATACLRAGADDAIDRAAGDAALFARMRAMLREQDARRDLAGQLSTSAFSQAARIDWRGEAPGRIGWISQHRSRALALQARLSATRACRGTVLDPATLLGRAPMAVCPDIYIIDHDLGRHGSGLAWLSDLGTRPHSREAMALIAVAHTDDMAAAFDRGAAGVILGDIDADELAARLTAILRRKRQRDRLRAALEAGLAMAVQDPLTQLQNRRSAMDGLGTLSAGRRPAGLLMIDIDHFKAVNDRHGHATGDAVLIAVAQQLRRSLRSANVLSRMGGEEFLAAVPGATIEGAAALAEAVRANIAGLRITTDEAPDGIAVTISIGVAYWSPGVSMEHALAASDRALYAAKRGGRNRVHVAAPLPA